MLYWYYDWYHEKDDIIDIINYEINMTNPHNDTQKQKKYIFNNLIGDFKHNNDLLHTDFVPIDYKESIFMKNLEALMFLNNSLHQFQKLLWLQYLVKHNINL